MYLEKIKNTKESCDLDLGLFMSLKTYDGYIVVDEFKEPYKIFVDKLNKVYWTQNSKGELSMPRFCNNSSLYIVENDKGEKIKLKINDDVDDLYSVKFDDHKKLLNASMICFAVSEGFKVCDYDCVRKMIASGFLVCNNSFADCMGNLYVQYKLTEIAKEFLCADFGKLSSREIDKYMSNSNLTLYKEESGLSKLVISRE